MGVTTKLSEERAQKNFYALLESSATIPSQASKDDRLQYALASVHGNHYV